VDTDCWPKADRTRPAYRYTRSNANAVAHANLPADADFSTDGYVHAPRHTLALAVHI
jgi:hypothetical protein